MPVLGGPSSSTGSGNLARGLIVPTGSLDVFKAAFKAHGSSRCEVVVIGDSTDEGANDFQSNQVYPWASRLLDQMRAAGVTYGGRGLFNYRMYANAASPETVDPDGYPLVSAVTGWANNATAVNGWTAASSGSTITFQGTGTKLRLLLQRGTNTNAKIGVTVDGGTETVYDSLLTKPVPTSYDVIPQLVTGLTEGVHTVIYRHAGGSDIKAPAVAQTSIGTGAGSGPTTGTYWYGITAVSANGESAMSTALSVAVNGSQIPQMSYYAQTGWTTVNLYRSTTQGGTYGLVGTQASPTVPADMTVAKNVIADSTGTGTPGAAPPGSSTLGALTGQSASAGIEFIRDAGIIIHNEAITGNSFTNYITHDGTSASGWRGFTPVRFGLQTESQAYTSNRNIGFLNGLPAGSKPQYRDVKLVMFKLGTNDLNISSPTTDGLSAGNWTAYFENLSYAIRTARAAGADVLLISPPFTNATDPGANHYSGRFKSAALTTALAHGCAYADFQEALGWDMTNFVTKGYQGGSTGIANPHLRVPGYQAEADWLWTNLFQPLLTS